MHSQPTGQIKKAEKASKEEPENCRAKSGHMLSKWFFRTLFSNLTQKESDPRRIKKNHREAHPFLMTQKTNPMSKLSLGTLRAPKNTTTAVKTHTAHKGQNKRAAHFPSIHDIKTRPSIEHITELAKSAIAQSAARNGRNEERTASINQ